MEAQAIHAEGDRIVDAFMREALPGTGDETRRRAGELVVMTLTAVGKQFSETTRTAADTAAYADAMSDMFCAYLREIVQA